MNRSEVRAALIDVTSRTRNRREACVVGARCAEVTVDARHLCMHGFQGGRFARTNSIVTVETRTIADTCFLRGWCHDQDTTFRSQKLDSDQRKAMKIRRGNPTIGVTGFASRRGRLRAMRNRFGIGVTAGA